MLRNILILLFYSTGYALVLLSKYSLLNKQKINKLNTVSNLFQKENEYSSSVVRIEASDRIRNLRDLVVQKDILKDLTASEFAIRLEVKQNASKIDYDKLISNLDNDINILKLQKNQKSLELLNRINTTKYELIHIKNGEKWKELRGQTSSEITKSMEFENENISSNNTTNKFSDVKSVQELRESLKLIVREDGTVDWDEARETSKEVARFGSELWERINGKEEGLPTMSELFGQMQSKIIETSEISRLTEITSLLENELNDIKNISNQLKVKLREQRKKGETIDPCDIQKLQKLEVQTKEIEKRSRLFHLNLDIERICTYLEEEIESNSNSLELRSLIAEVALIDKQLTNILAGLRLNIGSSSAEVAQSMALSNVDKSNIDIDSSTIQSNIPSPSSSSSSPSSEPLLLSLIDDDELTLIYNEVNDLKSQLGLGSQKNMDWGSLGVVVSDSISKIKQGLGFYSDGTKILVNDLQYAWYLIIKAVQGTILKPREVNSIRRTGKDILTLIPFTIILIIPLSPIGHVLVFSFIQRFFPDFFPSCYTEKRLNLGKLLSEIENKNLDDLLGIEESNSYWGAWSGGSSTASATTTSNSKMSSFSVPMISKFHEVFENTLGKFTNTNTNVKKVK